MQRNKETKKQRNKEAKKLRNKENKCIEALDITRRT
jgi:hypothetical protein